MGTSTRSNGSPRTRSSFGYVPRARPNSTCALMRPGSYRCGPEPLEEQHAHPILTAIFASCLSPCDVCRGSRRSLRANVWPWQFRMSRCPRTLGAVLIPFFQGDDSGYVGWMAERAWVGGDVLVYDPKWGLTKVDP